MRCQNPVCIAPHKVNGLHSVDIETDYLEKAFTVCLCETCADARDSGQHNDIYRFLRAAYEWEKLKLAREKRIKSYQRINQHASR